VIPDEGCDGIAQLVFVLETRAAEGLTVSRLNTISIWFRQLTEVGVKWNRPMLREALPPFPHRRNRDAQLLCYLLNFLTFQTSQNDLRPLYL
jgi:hypothetical protein